MARSEPSSSMMLQLRIFLLYFPENLLDPPGPPPPPPPPPPTFWSARPFTFRRLKNLSILRVTFNSQVWQDFYWAALWVSRGAFTALCLFSPNLLQKIFSLSWEMDIFSRVPSPLWTVGELCYVEAEEGDWLLTRWWWRWCTGSGGRGGRGRGEVAELHARLHWLLQSGSSQVRARHWQPTPAGPANTTEHIRSDQSKINYLIKNFIRKTQH